jgi:hypothetical protein
MADTLLTPPAEDPAASRLTLLRPPPPHPRGRPRLYCEGRGAVLQERIPLRVAVAAPRVRSERRTGRSHARPGLRAQVPKHCPPQSEFIRVAGRHRLLPCAARSTRRWHPAVRPAGTDPGDHRTSSGFGGAAWAQCKEQGFATDDRPVGRGFAGFAAGSGHPFGQQPGLPNCTRLNRLLGAPSDPESTAAEMKKGGPGSSRAASILAGAFVTAGGN